MSEDHRMSGMDEGAADAAPDTGTTRGAGSATAGQLLRAAREARGLHIAALAAMLKVPQAKLEMLEADRWRELPDATFARALAKAVCRTLKIEAGPVLALLPRDEDRELNVSLGLNTPYRDRGEASGAFSGDTLRKPIVWAPVLLLIAAAAVYYAPPLHWSESHPEAAASTAQAAASDDAGTALAAASVPETSASTAATSVPDAAANQPPTPTAATAASTPSVASASRASAPAPAASRDVAVARPASQPPASVAPPVHVVTGDELPLTFKTTSETWVQIVDASGQTVVSRLLPAGSEQVFAGEPPLKVTIGNVSGTQLLLRGQPVDLSARTQNNVARIEVQ